MGRSIPQTQFSSLLQKYLEVNSQPGAKSSLVSSLGSQESSHSLYTGPLIGLDAGLVTHCELEWDVSLEEGPKIITSLVELYHSYSSRLV